jgi:beta-barrel assembly-enhancing protease
MKMISATMRRRLAAVLLALVTPTWLSAPALAQPAGLPDLGSAANIELSPALERALGDSIIAQGRRDPSFVHDAQINQYLNEMGQRLARYASGNSPFIDVFAVLDPAFNAFALPGGYIGVNTGLIVQSDAESELAGVVAHEIAHVTQRHVARGLTQQRQSNHIAMAAVAAALLAALAGSVNAAAGISAFGQAAAVDQQLGFSRDAEREADRMGYHMLSKAGYDPNGLQLMFSKLMSNAQFNMGGAGGMAYLSTHPLSVDRMTDMQNRTQLLSRDIRESSDAFWYVRARALVLQTTNRHDLTRVVEKLQDEGRRFKGVQRSAAWLGLSELASSRKQFADAKRFLDYARQNVKDSPYLDYQAASLALAQGQFSEALSLSRKAFNRWPNQRALAQLQANSLMKLERYSEASQFLRSAIRKWPTQSPIFYQMLATTLSNDNQPVQAREVMADYYVLTGAYAAAMNQLQQARSMTDDFHEQSKLDVAIKSLQARMSQEQALLERFNS